MNHNFVENYALHRMHRMHRVFFLVPSILTEKWKLRAQCAHLTDTIVLLVAFPVKYRFYLRLPSAYADKIMTIKHINDKENFKNTRVIDDNVQSDLIIILYIIFCR